MIEENGDYLFLGFAWLSFILIGWILLRRRKRPVRDFAVVILPLGHAPKREDDAEFQPFEEPPDS